MINIFTNVAYAVSPHNVNELVRAIDRVIINPLIYFMFVLALVIFLWGMVEYLIHANEAAKRQEGGQHILWGIIGMAIMLSVFTIMNIITSSLGIPQGTINPDAGPGQEIVNLN